MYRIVKKEALKPTVILYEIEAPMVAKKAEPGQFIILRVDENGERIPITIHDYDREKGTVTIIVQTVGATTEKLSHKQQGECLHDFVGPLGKPTETEGKKKVCVVGGGVLVYGIPEFRLPKAIVQKEVDGLKAMGVKVETNTVVGRTITIDELMEEYGFEAVFIGSGAGLPMFMNIPGENLKGVYSANEFLTRINLMKAYREDSDTPIMDLKGKTVAVVGGGNVAMDAARCSKRLGAEVYVVYRRGMEELPARHEEVEHAIEEGVIFKTLNNPVQINGDEQDCVKSMTCIEMELGEPDASGRRRPVEKKGSEFDLSVDAVIMSLGTSPNPLIKSTTKGLEVNKKGGIIVNEEGLTSRQAVYAGGDAVTGAATVILAMGAGKLGAKSIDEYLSK